MARCIVAADDDDDIRAMIQKLLEGRGHVVRPARDGEVALALARAPDVDLVLLDMMMPGLTGLQVLEALRGAGHEVPVIMLTASGDPELVTRALEVGADDYVTKPFSPVVLLARMERRMRPPAAPRAAAPPTAAPASFPAGAAPDDAEELDASSAILEQVPDLAGALDASTREPIPPPPVAEPAGTESGRVVSFLGRLRRAASGGGAARPPVVALSPGALVSGRYRVGPVIGRGAFGVVHRARHVDLETDVALKVLMGDPQQVTHGMSALERFRREAVRACRVRHENAVRVIDFGITEAERPYLVMELLEGTSLAARLARGPLPPAEGALVLSAVLGALAAAHAQGVIHQDVKASNVFLHGPPDAGVPKLIDFGAAAETRDRQTHLVVGTPSHMAPERFSTGHSAPAGDVYSAGVLLFNVVTAELPCGSEDVDELARWHSSGPRPSVEGRGLPRGWDGVLARLMAVDPAQRPAADEAATLVRSLARA